MSPMSQFRVIRTPDPYAPWSRPSLRSLWLAVPTDTYAVPEYLYLLRDLDVSLRQSSSGRLHDSSWN